MTAVKTLLALFPVSFLTLGCSGGGGGDAAPVTPGVQITTENAQQVAKRAIQAAFGLADVGNIGSGLVVVPQPMDTPSGSLMSMVQQQVGSVLAGETLLAAAGSASQTLAGPEGGQVIHTWEDRDGDEQLSDGDTFVSAFTDYGARGLVLNGVVLVDEVTVTGTPPTSQQWGVAGRMTFVNLDVAAGGDPTTLAGSLRFRRENRVTTEVLDLDLDRGFRVGDAVLQPGNTIGYNTYPIEYAFLLAARGAVQVDGIDGLITYETTQPFTGLTLFTYPWAGELEVRGAGKSTIVVRMTDYTSMFVIEIDVDGDGEVDETIDGDWNDL